MISTDTIAALSSSAGIAPRAIVRLSGNLASIIVDQLANLPASAARSECVLLHIGNWRIPGTLYFFAGPHSYTGEDLAELHVPGNPIIWKKTLQQCVESGARLAEPGEFTARAFFNGKIDLTQAEGIAATIGALNDRQLAAARQLMAGELARRLTPITQLIANTLALIEAGIDFVNEEISFISTEDVRQRIDETCGQLNVLMETSAYFGAAGAEPTVVLVGRPNAGKSTLLNALAKCERAIVSPTAGTTRDALSADVVLPHGIIKMIDVAGLEEQPAQSEIDQRMQARATATIESADFVLHLVDSEDDSPPPHMSRVPDLRVRTKIDLRNHIAADEIGVSAVTGAGIDRLRSTIDRLVFGTAGSEAALTLNSRHIHQITTAQAALDSARSDIDRGHEYVALHLRDALDHLGQITGTISPDDLLGKIFSQFCIGK